MWLGVSEDKGRGRPKGSPHHSSMDFDILQPCWVKMFVLALAHIVGRWVQNTIFDSRNLTVACQPLLCIAGKQEIKLAAFRSVHCGCCSTTNHSFFLKNLLLKSGSSGASLLNTNQWSLPDLPTYLTIVNAPETNLWVKIDRNMREVEACCLRYSTLHNFSRPTFTFSIEVGD